ncbi:MAG: S8 family serine peptidase [Micrococcales bacterium]|nr:S8 family serine peptidase [Micrococcales bacterium]
MARPSRRRAAVALALVAGLGGGLLAPATAGAATTAHVPAAVQPLPGEWWWSAMGVDELHRKGTGKGVTVAVIDGPIDSSVPELRGRVASSRSFCNDPRRGTDFVKRSPRATGKDAEHATSMAALIAGSGKGTGPGGRGIRGIAPDATIRHYAVSYLAADGSYRCGVKLPDGTEQNQAIADAIRQAAVDGADVISISLVSNFTASMVGALQAAYGHDAIVVAGTPNENVVPQWPGLGNGVLLVNTVDRQARIPSFAVQGSPFISLTAPGKDVMAASYDASGWHSETVASGSSIATALVSGGIAALRSAYPSATSGQILHAVKDNVGLRKSGSGYETWFRRVGTDLPPVRTANKAYGWGIFDPTDAVAVDPTTLPKDNPFVREGAAEEPSVAEVAAAMGLAGASASASPTPSASASSAPAASTSDAGTAQDSGTPWLPVGIGVVVVALLAAGGVALARRSRGFGPIDPSHPDPSHTDEGATGDPTSQGAVGAEGRKH